MPWQLSRVPKKPVRSDDSPQWELALLLTGLLPVAFFVHATTRAASPEAEFGSYAAAIIFGFVHLYFRQQE